LRYAEQKRIRIRGRRRRRAKKAQSRETHSDVSLSAKAEHQGNYGGSDRIYRETARRSSPQKKSWLRNKELPADTEAFEKILKTENIHAQLDEFEHLDTQLCFAHSSQAQPSWIENEFQKRQYVVPLWM
jgi:hypothetical protein